MVGRPHRARGAARHRAFRPGSRRNGCRDLVRWHRLLARNDDRFAGGARHAAGGFYRCAHSRHHPAFDGREPVQPVFRRPAGVARPRHVRLHLRGDCGKRPHPDRQSGDPSRTDDGARGDGPRIFRSSPRHDRSRRRAEAAALLLSDRLSVRSLRYCDGREGWGRAPPPHRQLSRQGPAAVRAASDRRNHRRQNESVPLSDLPRRRVRRRRARRVSAVRVAGLLMGSLSFDIAHLLAGGMLVLSFLLLYQDRITAVLNVFALQAITLALSVAWQSLAQNAPYLIVTAAIALIVKGFVIPSALHRIVRKLEIHREIEQVIGGGPTMLTGLLLVALSILLLQPVGEGASVITREDLAFALAIVLLGLLMMITRRNAVTQIVGFMSLENGLVLAATGAKGMPLVVEFSVAFSILIALIVFGVFVFRIRERFDTVDVGALDRFRGERSDHA